MSFHHSQTELPVRHLAVYPGEAFRVSLGANEGDPIGDARDLVHEDIYALAEAAPQLRLALTTDETGALRVSPESAVGRPGAPVFLDCLVTFMSSDCTTAEALIFVEVDAPSGTIAQVWLHPLAQLMPRVSYSLVTVDTARAAQRFAAEAAVAFTRGTRITMADGRQVPIEDLAPGDRVLTRDSGPQEVRWIGQQTLRATGTFAPITIAAGALNNTADLVVSPNHRLFIYQRVDALGAGRKEVLVKAGLLVNGTSVVRTQGGFVDYIHILFDKHEIIYAEGIAAESLFVEPATRPALPDEVARRLRALDEARPVGAARSQGRELGRELVEADLAQRADPAAALKRLSAL